VTGPATQTGIVGREAELEAVRRFLDGMPDRAAGLLIEGDAGIGKTTIWEAAVESCGSRGWTVLAARPAASETGISFVGLIDLLGPVVDAISQELPPPQREALDGALLRGSAGSTHAVGAVLVAVTSVLRHLAGRSSRLVLAIDDLHWLDTSTRRALDFAIRRLGSMPLLLLASTRTGAATSASTEAAVGPECFERLEVGPLSVGALYQLIRGRTGRSLPRPQVVRVHEVSGGNPLYALELASVLDEAADAIGPHGVLPVPPRLNELLSTRLRRLPARTSAALRVASAMSQPRVDTLAAALEQPVAAVVDDLAPAERAGVIALDRGAIRFAHPLLASIIYDDVDQPTRRRAHRLLAKASTTPEEHARHLALAAPGPDETVAAALDGAVDESVRRGTTDGALELAERALAMTPPNDDLALARRAARAGSLAATVGDQARARVRLGTAAALLPAGPERAAVLLELAEVADPPMEGLALCKRALDESAAEPRLSSRIHRTRGAIAYVLGLVADAEGEAALAVELARGTSDPAVLGAALGDLGHWTFCGGGGIRRDLFDQAIALDPGPGMSSPRGHFAKVLMDAGHLSEARPMLEELLAAANRLGDLRAAAVYLLHLGELEVWAGRWALAIERAEESLLIRQHTNQPAAPLYVKAMALACLGHLDAAQEAARLGLAEAERGIDLVGIMQNLRALGFAAVSVGDYAAAQPLLARATDLHRPRWTNEFGDSHCVVDDIEASLGVGDIDRARELVAWMDRVGRATQRPWTLAMAARSQGLVHAHEGALDKAQAALDEALEQHERMEMPFELARTLLVAGTILRRRKQRGRSAELLRRAQAVFESLGAVVWLDRATAEIDRIGLRSEAQRGLTPIEEQIARLVAEGMTNREIAERVFLSPKTVEANLSRVYRKLDLRSRAELASALLALGQGRGRDRLGTRDSPDYAATTRA
jgi:DNA-binding CsgD family transcriptional regulator